jgi:hypothetical protein
VTEDRPATQSVQATRATCLRLQDSIWDAELRAKCAELRKSDRELNDLRAQHIVPGTRLVAGAEDPFVPVLLVPGAAANQWTLVLPRHWGRPFWRSLVYSRVRFGGLEQAARIARERGAPAFPYDFPGTTAYAEYIALHAAELERTHLAKPPAKRVNYEAMQVPSPFRPAFAEGSWLMPLAMFQSFAAFCRERAEEDPLVSWSQFTNLDLALDQALVQGAVLLASRGHPAYNALITVGEETVGYLTGGFFSLRRGRGFGFGCIRAAAALALLAADGIAVQVRNTSTRERRAAVFKPC